jgi:ribose 5-phosphate isomerase B
MKIALGTDHGGYQLKTAMAATIERAGHEVLDCGAAALDSDDDYPVFAERVALAVTSGRADRGLVLCGSGVGASVAANKIHGVRAALCHDTFSAHQGVEDDDMNVLCIGARVVGASLAAELVEAFLRAKFSGAERHRRRLEMVRALEATGRGLKDAGR